MKVDKRGIIGFVDNNQNVKTVSIGVSYCGVGVSVDVPYGKTIKSDSGTAVAYPVKKSGSYAFYSQKYIKGTYTVVQTRRWDPLKKKESGKWSKKRLVKKTVKYNGSGATTNPVLYRK